MSKVGYLREDFRRRLQENGGSEGGNVRRTSVGIWLSLRTAEAQFRRGTLEDSIDYESASKGAGIFILQLYVLPVLLAMWSRKEIFRQGASGACYRMLQVWTGTGDAEDIRTGL